MPIVPKHPWVEVVELGDVTLCRITQQRIQDEHQITLVADVLQAMTDDANRRKFIINLAVAEIMSSSMVGKLIAVHKKVRAAGGQLVLCCIHPSLARVFEIGGLKRVFTIADDQAAAFLALGEDPSGATIGQ